MHQLIIWDNEGLRRTKACADLKEALAAAKQARTLANRTVKIADAYGAIYHWTRSGASKNHWCARAVANEGFV